MRSLDEIYADILRRPERDDLRLEYADACEPSDPKHAWLIRKTIALVQADGYEYVNVPEDVDAKLSNRLEQFGDVSCVQDRGFIGGIALDPRVFVDHGDEIMQLAPILRVRFVTEDFSKRGYEFPLMKELLASPGFARIREASFIHERFPYESLEMMLDSANLGSLLKLETSGVFRYAATEEQEAAQEREMWPRLFAHPVFRGMIDWGLGPTKRQVGDQLHIEEEFGPRTAEVCNLHTWTPMPPEDRAVEAQYGYIPRLHAANQGAKLLDWLRGNKPDYPVGARPIAEMYAVPAPELKFHHMRDFDGN
jgi:hypothetical protein